MTTPADVRPPAPTFDPEVTETLREILADPALPVGTLAAIPRGERIAALREALDHLGTLRLATGPVRSATGALDLVAALAEVDPELADVLRWHATLGPVFAGLPAGPGRNAVLGDVYRGDLLTWSPSVVWEWVDGGPPTAAEPLRRARGELRVEAYPGLFDAIVAWEPAAGALLVVPTPRGRHDWEPVGADGADGWRVRIHHATFHAHDLVVTDDPRTTPTWREHPPAPLHG